MPKPSTRVLPQFGHSYGLPGARDPEGVGQRKYIPLLLIFAIVTTKWTAHYDSKKPRNEKDFKATNKIALRSRATTARAQTAFRRTFNNQMPRL